MRDVVRDDEFAVEPESSREATPEELDAQAAEVPDRDAMSLINEDVVPARHAAGGTQDPPGRRDRSADGDRAKDGSP